MASSDPFHHVRDFGYFELPGFAAQWLGLTDNRLWLPNIAGFQITKFMVLQVVAGLLTLIIFSDLARRIRGGKPAMGIWANFWEMIALFIRDNVVRPTLGHKHEDSVHHNETELESVHEVGVHAESGHRPVAGVPVLAGAGIGPIAADHPEDRFLPLVWSCFFYVLFCNLLGAIPMLGSATGNINVTGVLALCAFACTFIVGVKELGLVGFFTNLVPPLDAPFVMKIFLVPMIFVIEVFGLLVKHAVLAIRLFANMMGGHTVVGVILGFIAAAPVVDSWLWYLVTPASIFGQIAVGMLELFVAFLQAYVFAFLATIFIGMGSHPH